MQRAKFINVEINFIDVEKQICSFWNLNMKKHSDLVSKLENKISLGGLWENNDQFFKKWT